jgi:sulfoxide reductase heme-binding subunit YedZ
VDWFFAWGLMGGEIVKHKYILVGMASFLLLVPLALTSTNGWVRRLGGKRWRRLHALIYLIAIGGTVHYLWAVKKDTLFPLVYLSVFAALLAYRVVVRRGLRRPQPARTRSGAADATAFQRSE